MKLKTSRLVLISLFLGTLMIILLTHITEAELPQIELIGQATLATGFSFKNTTVGGLSGITYNPQSQVYYTISDDPSQKNPARFYTLKIDLSSKPITTDQITFLDVTTLLTTEGNPFPTGSLDPEGITFSGNSLFIASEGNINANIPPFIKEFSLTGQELRSLPIPDKFLSSPLGKKQGFRQNLALESLTITPDKNYLFTANESALIQDGEEATLTQGTPCRILRYNLTTGKPDQEFLYITDPLATEPLIPGTISSQGLVDLVALDKYHIISLERSFSLGIGNTIKLFLLALENAEDIQKIDDLKNQTSQIYSAQKTLILDLSSLEDVFLDNIEGLTLGDRISDKEQALILISDNNFNPLQITQILTFKLRL